MKVGQLIQILSLSPMLMASAVVAQDQTKTDFALPPACQQATHMAGKMDQMGGMKNMEAMQQSMGRHMSTASKGLMQAIIDMHPPMMQGAIAENPDVAFNCSMIAHHKGAIAMAKVQLQFGKDAEAKKMAQKMIDQQSKEVEEMTQWVEAHTK